MHSRFLKTILIVGATLGLASIFLATPGFAHGAATAQIAQATAPSDVTLQNPLKTDDPIKFLGIVIKAVLGILGGIALLMFVMGGFLWMTSAGSTERIQKGRDTIVWAAIGIGVIFASYAMVDFVIKGLTAAK